MSRRASLILLAVFTILLYTCFMWIGTTYAQDPGNNNNSQPIEPTPTLTPSLQLTGAGWLEISPLSADISASALTPVNCGAMTPPVVGYEISKGQDSNDITSFSNDLVANGFSVGTVDISSGIPACVSVLIVQGLSQNLGLPAAYTAADAAQIKAWVAAGHGLMLSGEWGPFIPSTQELFQAYGYSLQGIGPPAVPVVDPSDADPAGPANSWVIYQTDNFATHPVLNGVTSMEFLAGAWLSSAANAIVTTDNDATPANQPVVTAFNDGSGCVTMIADSNWNSETAVNGYAKEQNALVARQMIDWLSRCSTLTLDKSALPNPVIAGQIVTYILTATNNFNPAVTNVVITDTVPTSTTFVSATTPHTGPDAKGVVTWPLGTLNFKASATVTMTVRVDAVVPNGAIITNTAWITSTENLSDTASAAVSVLVANQGTVDGLVWQDLNGNGVPDAGEPVLPNITVTITDSLGIPQMLVTDANGRYTSTVAPGTVTIDIDQSDLDLSPNSTLTTGNDPATINVAGGAARSINFGFQSPPSATGIVWHDLNGNGLIDPSEPRLPNITIITIDNMGITQTTVTDATGRYLITVVSGTVIIDVDQTDPDLPANSALTTANDPTAVLILAGGFAGVNFGFQSPPAPPPAPPPAAPPPPDKNNDDDDDDGGYIPAPTATPLPPGQPVIIDPPPTTESLPVTFLPETGHRTDKPGIDRTKVGLVTVLLLLVIGIAFKLLMNKHPV